MTEINLDISKYLNTRNPFTHRGELAKLSQHIRSEDFPYQAELVEIATNVKLLQIEVEKVLRYHPKASQELVDTTYDTVAKQINSLLEQDISDDNLKPVEAVLYEFLYLFAFKISRGDIRDCIEQIRNFAQNRGLSELKIVAERAVEATTGAVYQQGMEDAYWESRNKKDSGKRKYEG